MNWSIVGLGALISVVVIWKARQEARPKPGTLGLIRAMHCMKMRRLFVLCVAIAGRAIADVAQLPDGTAFTFWEMPGPFADWGTGTRNVDPRATHRQAGASQGVPAGTSLVFRDF